MINCPRCDAPLLNFRVRTPVSDNSVTADMGVGNGEYFEFNYCLDFGQIQGEFPLPPTDWEKSLGVDEMEKENK